jgi:toxin YoeB
MKKYTVKISKTADADIEKHKRSGKKSSIKKIARILDELEAHPYSGTGKPEALKHELSGKWSRRINKKDRIIYTVHDQMVEVAVLSAMGHYSD